jgi:hypothetical protein
MAVPLAIAFGAFAAGTLIAELAGAANLGTAMTFGQIAFAIAVVGLLLRRAPGTSPTSAGAAPGAPTARR